MSELPAGDDFKPNGDGYDISAAGVIWIAATSMHDPDIGDKGNRLARLLVLESLAAMRKARYPKAEYLETLLIRGSQSDAQTVLAMLRDACKLIGEHTVIATVGRLIMHRDSD